MPKCNILLAIKCQCAIMVESNGDDNESNELVGKTSAGAGH